MPATVNHTIVASRDREESARFYLRTRPGETNTEHGGRGVCLLDPTGHYLELPTRPYF